MSKQKTTTSTKKATPKKATTEMDSRQDSRGQSAPPDPEVAAKDFRRRIRNHEKVSQAVDESEKHLTYVNLMASMSKHGLFSRFLLGLMVCDHDSTWVVVVRSDIGCYNIFSDIACRDIVCRHGCSDAIHGNGISPTQNGSTGSTRQWTKYSGTWHLAFPVTRSGNLLVTCNKIKVMGSYWDGG
ncbi:uncharacterized protein PV07_08810 [Cladophialophora immunda]|uniref:Uncharacterized protein n=1 Tax=Cladophialophora immunda TaxID=569365 RepID=A0A0D2CPX9_9EURO|nr:uncharacterized protein PV07_08810 [Cladophialophora immunda]KIW25644.1 hypothetical protein PV07_08810 [Cladophialophora immunda]